MKYLKKNSLLVNFIAFVMVKLKTARTLIPLPNISKGLSGFDCSHISFDFRDSRQQPCWKKSEHKIKQNNDKHGFKKLPA